MLANKRVRVEYVVMSQLERELLDQIDDTVQDVFDLGTRREAQRREGSRRTVYEKALKETQAIAGDGGATALAQWLQEEIRENQSFPSGRDVRQRGARICRENGHQVSTGSWLGA